MRLNSCMIEGCGRYFKTSHHVKTRGSGGSNDTWNLMPLCMAHHQEVHSSGLTMFSERHKEVTTWLLKMNWEYDKFYKKWRHYAD